MMNPHWGGRPPQILKQDLPVLREYMRTFGDDYTGVYYNVAMSFQNLPKDKPPNIAASWLMATALRVDALGVTKTGEAHIMEITRHAGLRAMGQIIGYKFMYEQLKPLPYPCKAFIVCYSHGYDIPIILKHFKCGIITLKPAPIRF